LSTDCVTRGARHRSLRFDLRIPFDSAQSPRLAAACGRASSTSRLAQDQFKIRSQSTAVLAPSSVEVEYTRPREPTAARFLEYLAQEDRARIALLSGVAILYLPFIFFGPGSDADSLRVLNSGATLLWHHRYVASRPPGSFPYEALTGILYPFGGTVATNLATVAMSIALLASFLKVCEHFEVPHRLLLGATIAIHPIYWASSTSTIDFIWALGCFFIGFNLLLKTRRAAAAAMLGLAVGIRLSSVLLVAPLLVWELAKKPRDFRVWLTATAATAIGMACYIPAFLHAGNSMSFLTYYAGDWSVAEYIGRFIYKNIYFWGLPAAVFFIVISPMMVRGLLRADRKYSGLIIFSATIMIALEALFLKLPVQRAYLLPMLPFVLILFAIAFRDRRMLIAMVMLIFSFDLVNLNLAQPDVPDRATHVTIGLFVEPGYLLNDAAARLQQILQVSN
jgi:hypothetical protein